MGLYRLATVSGQQMTWVTWRKLRYIELLSHDGSNMELDLPKFIWALVYSCNHWLILRNSPPPPAFGLIYDKKDDISL